MKTDNEVPSSMDAERAVLGSILLNPDCYDDVVEVLRYEDFYYVRNGHVFKAMQSLVERNVPIDMLTLVGELKTMAVLDTVGGSGYLTMLANDTPTHIHAVIYAEMIHRMAVRRRLLVAAGIAATAALDETISLDEAMDTAEDAIFSLRREQSPAKVTFQSALQDHWSTVDTLMNLPEEEATLGLPTGFVELDKMLSGLQKGLLYILAGRPGMGKTALLCNIAITAASTYKTPVGFFSAEMSTQQLVGRILSTETGISSMALSAGRLTPQEYERYLEAQVRLKEWPFLFDDTPGISLTAIESRLRIWKREYNPGLIIIDYLQLLHATSRKYGQNREQEVAEIARVLKELARIHNVPVLSAAQLSRAVEQREDKRPQLSDLRESGAIEQNADIVGFLYRDDYYNADSERPNQADLIIAKHRNGPTGTATMYFNKQIMTFANMQKRQVDLRPYSMEEEPE